MAVEKRSRGERRKGNAKGSGKDSMEGRRKIV